MISVCGVAIATLAMVCTMSVFNGFQDLVSQMFGAFDPELKIVANKGKVFDINDEKIVSLKNLEYVDVYSEVLEENALLKYQERQVPALVKGVTDNFGSLTKINETLLDGTFKLSDEVNNFGTIGAGLASKLGIYPGAVFPIEIYAPKRNAEVNMSNPASSFTRDYIYIGGIFMINQPVYDENVIIIPIELAKSLFDYENEISALELKLKKDVSIDKIQKEIEEKLGSDYIVKNQYQQQEASFQMMNIEKWMTFLILCFILVIAVFNIIGSLSMLIVEKQQDVIMLKNMGASKRLISHIFLFEGWLISASGAVIGIILGILLCIGQEYFGWLKMGTEGIFVVDSYPVKLIFSDTLFVFVTVLIIGFLAALYPVSYLTKKWLK